MLGRADGLDPGHNPDNIVIGWSLAQSRDRHAAPGPCAVEMEHRVSAGRLARGGLFDAAHHQIQCISLLIVDKTETP